MQVAPAFIISLTGRDLMWLNVDDSKLWYNYETETFEWHKEKPKVNCYGPYSACEFREYSGKYFEPNYGPSHYDETVFSLVVTQRILEQNK